MMIQKKENGGNRIIVGMNHRRQTQLENVTIRTRKGPLLNLMDHPPRVDLLHSDSCFETMIIILLPLLAIVLQQQQQLAMV